MFSLTGILLFVGTLVISLIATARVKSAVHKYSQVPVASGYTGAQVAAQILRAAGIRDVEIVAYNQPLGDHYDPSAKRLVLSAENYQSDSVAAVGIAAHECGHAIQHQVGYAPLELRMMAVSATTFASQIVMWLPFLGLATGLIYWHTALWIMVIAWGVIMLFNLVTLPVEFDASRRAKLILSEMGVVNAGDEALGVRRVLDAAAWTYVAAFLTSLAYFLWYLLPMLTGGRSRD